MWVETEKGNYYFCFGGCHRCAMTACEAIAYSHTQQVRGHKATEAANDTGEGGEGTTFRHQGLHGGLVPLLAHPHPTPRCSLLYVTVVVAVTIYILSAVCCAVWQVAALSEWRSAVQQVKFQVIHTTHTHTPEGSSKGSKPWRQQLHRHQHQTPGPPLRTGDSHGSTLSAPPSPPSRLI